MIGPLAFDVLVVGLYCVGIALATWLIRRWVDHEVDAVRTGAMMTRHALYITAIAVWAAGIAGFVLGVGSSNRMNTIAAMTYAKSVDLEIEARYQATLSAERADRIRETTDLQLRLARQEHDYANDLNEQAEVASERILGLREQLKAHGIRPANLLPARR